MSKNKEIQFGFLLQDGNLVEDKLVSELNEIIAQLDVHEQLELHGNLNNNQLFRLYEILNQVNMSPSAKEHITWKYFKNRYEGGSTRYFNKKLLEEIVDSYCQNKYLGLESLIIDALKSDSILPEQLPTLEQSFTSKAFRKEALAFKYRELVRNGEMLSKEQVTELLDLRAYTTLEFALDRKAIAKEDILEFRKPKDSEKDKKLKENLYRKASSLGNN